MGHQTVTPIQCVEGRKVGPQHVIGVVSGPEITARDGARVIGYPEDAVRCLSFNGANERAHDHLEAGLFTHLASKRPRVRLTRLHLSAR